MNGKRKHGQALLALCLVLMSLLAPLSVAADPAPAPTLTAEGEKALVYNLEYQTAIWSQGEKDTVAPAGFAKIMTAVLGFEYLAQHPGTTVTVSDYVPSKVTGTKVDLKAGEILPLEQLLYCLVVGSANDAALAIAQTVCGSEAEFVAAMNAKAQELGMTATYFSNPTGMDQSAMETTLEDMAKLCAYAYKINQYMLMTDTVDHTVPATNLSKARKLHTKNLLIDPNPYTGYYQSQYDVMGMNASSTTKAGFCLATTVRNSGLTYVILIAQGKYQNNVYSSFTDAATLIRYAVKEYALTTVLEKDTLLGELPVDLAQDSDCVALVSDRALEALLPASYDKTHISVNCIHSANRLTAPVEQGQYAGVVHVYYQNQLLGTANLVTQRGLALSGKDAFMASVGRFFQNPTVTLLVQIAAVVLALLLTVTVVLAILRSRRKNAAQRKAIQRYLQEDRQQFLLDKQEYRQKRLEKRKARQKAMRRLRDNYRRYKLEKQNPAPKTKPSSPPAQPPQAPPAPRRPGDEYYRK